MYQSIIATENEQLRDECQRIVDIAGEIAVNLYTDLLELELNGSFFNYLFIIISDINPQIFSKIKKIKKLSPDLSVIFYNHSLTLSSLNEVGADSEIKLIVGENRRDILHNLIVQIKKNNWRAIPYSSFNIEFDSVSPRIKKSLRYIESAEISDCNIANISAYLKISPGYFSQEFKRETGQSFRTFMQNVLNYYEDIIFTRINLPAKNISQLLGYSELSSFSRSFKKRKGVSPTKYKKMVKM